MKSTWMKWQTGLWISKSYFFFHSLNVWSGSLQRGPGPSAAIQRLYFDILSATNAVETMESFTCRQRKALQVRRHRSERSSSFD